MTTMPLLRIAVPLLAIATALSAQEPLPVLAPLNPDFVEWGKRQRDSLDSLDGLGHQALRADTRQVDNRFGFRPDPFRHSKLRGPATLSEAMVKAGLAAYPSKFDLRPGLPPIGNQNPFGTCWAFSALTSLQANMKRERGFSEWHMAWFVYTPVNRMPAFTKRTVKTGEDPVFDLGGNNLQVVALASRGTGPVDISYAPYQNTRQYPTSSLPKGTEPVAATVQDAFLLESSDTETIKGLVQTYGPVAASMLWPESELGRYSAADYAFRYVQTGKTEINHGINIVGWDDDFPLLKFPDGNQPASNGAWIIRNSWGASWGDSGYFYMSYDTTLGTLCSYIGSQEHFPSIYQYDFLGKVSAFGAGDTAWFSNVFTATGDDSLTDVAFYSSEPNAHYEISVKTGITGDPSTGARALGPQAGTLALPGYHRIKLSQPVNVTKGDNFAVIVKLREPGYNYPVSIICPYEDYSESATAQDRRGYYSWNGVSWTDVKKLNFSGGTSIDNVSICLKAFAGAASVLPISVSVSPNPATVEPGGKVQFSAKVVGGQGNQNVTWSKTGGGELSGGLYTAPNAKGAYTITATSVEDISKSGTAQVSVFSSGFDDNSLASPQLLGLARAFGSTLPADLAKYDLNNDGKINDDDIKLLFKAMGWGQ